MKYSKRIFLIMLLAYLSSTCLTGCQSDEEKGQEAFNRIVDNSNTKVVPFVTPTNNQDKKNQ